jgi:hypothetical protein
MTLLSLNNRLHSQPSAPKNPCPEISDLLQRIHELSALQENLGIKNCEILREVNIATLGRIGVNVSHLVAPLGEPVIDTEDPAVQKTPPPAIASQPPAVSPPEPLPTEFTYENEPDRVLFDPDFVPNNVIYVWCGRRWFEFVNYLSVKSVIRQLRPDNIIFYCDVEPDVNDVVGDKIGI